MDADTVQGQISARNGRYKRELEDYFRDEIIEGYASRVDKSWRRDYSSLDAYEKSVKANREQWRCILNPPALEISGELQSEPMDDSDGASVQFVRLPLGERLRAEAILALPRQSDGPVPLIIAQHGIGSSPEHVMGLLDAEGAYHAYGRQLVDAGFAVLAPFNLFGAEPRQRIVRMATLAGTTLPGLELVRVQRLLDVLLARPDIDEARVGIWGLSLGGMATQMWTPLEPRIRVAVSAAWFNKRLLKMVIPDPRYSCFLDTKEEHIFMRGWLNSFNDADLCSLICPRPFLIQTGKADGIGWWPQILEEHEELAAHYEKLGLEDRLAIDLHEGGHEVRTNGGIEWLRRWLP